MEKERGVLTVIVYYSGLNDQSKLPHPVNLLHAEHKGKSSTELLWGPSRAGYRTRKTLPGGATVLAARLVGSATDAVKCVVQRGLLAASAAPAAPPDAREGVPSGDSPPDTNPILATYEVTRDSPNPGPERRDAPVLVGRGVWSLCFCGSEGRCVSGRRTVESSRTTK